MVNSIKKMGRGYALEAYTRWTLKSKLQNLEQKNPVLVYQMGKVGSSSVVRTLKQLNLDSPVLHVHTLSPDHLKFAIDKQRKSISPFLHEHHVASSMIVKKMTDGLFPCRVVTLTREPVARAISFLFEDLKKQAPEAILGDEELDHEKLKMALDRLLAGQNGIADPTHWFDTELRDCMGVDVFSVPYNVEKGYSYIEKGPVRVLIIRMEDLDRSLLEGLRVLLKQELAGTEILKANIGGKKWYADALKHIKSTYRLPPGVAKQVFESRYCKHFYESDAERFRAKWA